jgi:DNA-binding transcriptional ArsR family regulator
MAGTGGGGERRDKEDHYRYAALAHPLRRQILRPMLDGREIGAAEIAAELGEPLGRIAYHLRVLVKRDGLTVAAQKPPAPARYRWSSQARWARKMLGEDGQ